MKELKDFKNQIHKCSKCGLCQSACPIYKVTGNDCSVSRGQFIMLKGVINGDLKLSKNINRYLNLCLKCGACSKSCPSGINVVDVIVAAKSEYFKSHFFEKIISWVQKNIVFGLFFSFINFFVRSTKSKKFEKKVLYFGGCRSKMRGDASLIKILNSLEIEVVNPNFSCCGIPLFVRGDISGFNSYIEDFVKILRKYNIKEIVTTCASCEKTIKDYSRWAKDESVREFLSDVVVRNIYEYIRENGMHLKLKKRRIVTYHKPCNIENYSDIEWILNNTEDLKYIEMSGYDNCCGLNGISKLGEFSIMKQIFKAKRDGIVKSGSNCVLTSCLGCEIALNLFSFGAYKTYDMLEFLAKEIR